MSMIKFIFLENDKRHFDRYIASIIKVLKEEGIPHSSMMTYEEGRNLKNIYWDYLASNDRTELNNAINKFGLLSDDTICFIDDNWKNSTSKTNTDGKNFVEKFLNNNEQHNVIMVTVYPDSYGTSYVKKGSDFEDRLRTEIKKTTPYKKYQRQTANLLTKEERQYETTEGELSLPTR